MQCRHSIVCTLYHNLLDTVKQKVFLMCFSNIMVQYNIKVILLGVIFVGEVR